MPSATTIFAPRPGPATAEDALVPARAQLASQPARFPTSYNTPEADAAAMSAETFAHPMVREAIHSLFTLPQRAIDASAADVQNLGTGQPLQSIGPALETAMTMMGGAGAFPAEANELRAGIRAYQKVPDSLMGYRKSGPQKAFDESAYPHTQDVAVTLPASPFSPRDTFVDQIKGMNPDHALERAWRNWPDALHIQAAPPIFAKAAR